MIRNRTLCSAPILLAWVTLVVSGCEPPQAHFVTNHIYKKIQENKVGEACRDQQLQDIVDCLGALFGTPDDPFLEFLERPNLDIDQVLDPHLLEYAAGPVSSDPYGQGRGLYRQHCAHCHGIAGNGAGPTALFLNPYPRDFRKGTFKFKSTPKGFKPTEADLRRTIIEGIPGTAMPSFKLLDQGELEALIDYVKYLSIRGEVERELLLISLDELDYQDDPTGSQRELRNALEDVLARVVDSWKQASSQVTPVPARPDIYDQRSPNYNQDEFLASVQRGRKLYFGAGECARCHGSSQLGDGETTNYDEWTTEFFPDLAKDPGLLKTKLPEYLGLGGLPPRNILPRNLRLGIYRGGRRPIDLYWRIHNGIDGTPMPAANMNALKLEYERLMASEQGTPMPGAHMNTLKPEEFLLWDLVNFVLYLPYDPLSQPESTTPVYQRERG